MAVISFEINGNGNSALRSYRRNSVSSHVVPISWRPFFSVALNLRKTRKIQLFHVQKLNYGPVSASLESGSNAGVLPKESEFKPSFDDYLTAMESLRAVRERKQPSDNAKLKLKEKNGMGGKPILDGDEGNKNLGTTGAPLDKNNDFEFASENEALDVDKTVESKKCSSLFKSNGELRGKGIKRLKHESKFDVMVKQKGEAVIAEDKRLKSQIRDSELESDDSGCIVDSSTTGGKLMDDLHSFNTLTEKDLTNSQRDSNSLGKIEGGSKIVARSKGTMHRGLERSYTKIEDAMNKNQQGNVKLNANSQKLLRREYHYDSMEVERAAFKTSDEFNDAMSHTHVSRREMEERILKLANKLNGADIDMPEWMFSKMMRSAKIKFNDYTIVRVIQNLGKLGNWRRVIQVIEWLQMQERFKSHKLRHIYTAALDALGKARRPVEALNVFHAMQQHMSSYPDIVAYRSIAVTLGQAGHMKELFDVIDVMQSPPKKKFKIGALGNWDPRLEPDIVVYNAVLNACVQQKQWEGTFWVLQQLKKQGLQPQAATYGLIMEVMFSCGKYNLVHEFFRKAQKSSISNSLTYKVLVNTLWKEGKTDEAILAVQDMERRGIVGSASLYYDLARCLCAAKRCDEALMQIEKIFKVANKPLVVTYTGLIKACLDSGNIPDAAYIFEKMKGACAPNLDTINIMLKAYVEHGMFHQAKELFEKMSENANCVRRNSDYNSLVIPNIYTFNTLLDASIAGKRWDYFDYVYQKMLHHGFHFNPKRHLRMILEASKAGKEGPLEATWKHLTQKDRIPPATLIKEMFCRNLEKDDHLAAIACITNNPSKDLQAFSKLSWLNLFKKNAQRFQKDTLVRLINEVNIIVSRSSLPNPAALINMMHSCKNFVTLDMESVETESHVGIKTFVIS